MVIFWNQLECIVKWMSRNKVLNHSQGVLWWDSGWNRIFEIYLRIPDLRSYQHVGLKTNHSGGSGQDSKYIQLPNVALFFFEQLDISHNFSFKHCRGFPVNSSVRPHQECNPFYHCIKALSKYWSTTCHYSNAFIRPEVATDCSISTLYINIVIK